VQRLGRVVALVGALACTDAVGPEGRLRLNIVPEFSQPVFEILSGDLTAVHIRVSRVRRSPAAAGAVVFDSTIAVDAAGNATVDVSVPLFTGTDTVAILLEGIRASDGVVLYSGTDTVAVSGGRPATLAKVPVSYVGPCQPGTGCSIVVAPQDSFITQGDSFIMRVTVDSAQTSLLNVPVALTNLTPTLVTIAPNRRITALPLTTGGLALIVAAIHGAADTLRLSVAQASGRVISVLPMVADLALGQTVPVLLQARDAAGTVTLTGVTWSSSDSSIAMVDPAGIVTPRAPGVVTITGDAGLGARASATMTILARRPNWYVDVRKAGAPIQLGSVAYPFESPVQAFPLVLEGDTIRVASGTYDFTSTGTIGTSAPSGNVSTVGGGSLAAGVVILGGTPGDTTTRPVFRDPNNVLMALDLQGGQRTLVRNVEFQNFFYAVNLVGVRTLALEDVKIVQPLGGFGIYNCGAPMDTVRLDRVSLLGDSVVPSGEAISYGGCAPTALTIIRDTKIRFWGDGLWLLDADSTEVLRSWISDNGDTGLFVSQQASGIAPAVHVAHSRVERNVFEEICVDYARRLVIDTSVVRARSSIAIEVSGGSIVVGSAGFSGGYAGAAAVAGLAEVYLHGDSIYHEADGSYWLEASAVDSMVMDQSVVRFPTDTSITAYGYASANEAFVTNMQFLNFGNGEAFAFYGSEALFDNIVMTGCKVSGCDGGSGLEAYASGSKLTGTIINSRFSSLRYPIYMGATSGTHVVAKVTIDSAEVGIRLNSDSAVVADNLLTRIYGTAVAVGGYSAGRGPSAVLRDSITCTVPASGGPTSGMVLSGLSLAIDGNAVGQLAETTGSCDIGISLSGSGTGTVVSRNRLRHGRQGVLVQQYDTTTVTLLSNGISGTVTAAVQVDAGHVVMTGNSIKNNLKDGLLIALDQGYTHEVHLNGFQGNGTAVNSPFDRVNAQQNWWGDLIGACQGTGDCNVGNVDASIPLIVDPTTGVVLPAPLLAGTAAFRTTTSDAAMTAAAPVTNAPRVVALPRTGLPPAVAARTQQAEAQRAAQAAARATRAEQRASQLVAQRRAAAALRN